MNLDEFILNDLNHGLIDHEDFYYLEMKKTDNEICIINIEAKRPGKGAYVRLLLDLMTECPEKSIVIWPVINSRFGKGLKRMGFQRTGHERYELKSNLGTNFVLDIG